MAIDEEKWSEIVSIALVYLQETLDELILLQMNERNIKNYFTHMYFDVSRDNETEETKALLEKINLFRENNHRIFVNTLDFFIAPLHCEIENLNAILNQPSEEAKQMLFQAFNVQARTELFINQLYKGEQEIITEYLELKEKELKVFKEEKLKLDQNLRELKDEKVEELRKQLLKFNF